MKEKYIKPIINIIEEISISMLTSSGAFDSELMYQEISIPDGFEAVIEGDKIILKKTESEDEKIRKELIDIVTKSPITFAFEDKNKVLSWLEKQGEQKPIIEIITPEESLGIDSETYNEIVNACIFGENKPKFKIGDWVVNRLGNIWHIDSFDAKNYQVTNTKGDHNYFPINIQDRMHLWTIADAKPGDVLVNDISVFIYAKVLYNKPYAYCGVDKFGVFKDNCLNNNWADSVDNIHPATKEQHDLLFSKMKEAGYEWDAEHKQLNKIEQKFAEWSEENEHTLQGIIDEIQANKNQAPDYDLATYDRFLSWLKSLKQRNTWKPSDAQMASITCAVRKMKESACYDSELVSLLNDLKKLTE